MPKPRKAVRLVYAVALYLVLGTWPLVSHAALVVRQPLESGVYAAVKGGRVLYLECRPPAGNAAKDFLGKYLAAPRLWTQYKDRMAVAIPFEKLSAKAQRQVLEAIFPDDYVDESGWWHTVVFQGETGVESWWVLAEWLTGMGTRENEIQQHEQNLPLGNTLAAGDTVLIPRSLLRKGLQALSPKRAPAPPPAPGPLPAPPTTPPTTTDGRASDWPLKYGTDGQGGYAEYRLKKGETLFTSVVVRFTDYREHAEIMEICKVVQNRSGIKDVRRMGAGQKILIPLEMLSDQYQPKGSAPRSSYEAVHKEAQKLHAERVRSKDLDGVVVILDAGHGGRDHGASVTRRGLYEDELAYDIVCRIKKLLESQTQAKLHLTIRDPNQNYAPSDSRQFRHDTDEVLLTTPAYNNQDARISANLRCYLANSLYRKARAQGTDERKIVFASIHCDALFDGRMRGAMVYVPGAQYRRDREQPSGSTYDRYQEARVRRVFTSTASQRRRDEALSRNFATTLLDTLRHNQPPLKVHSTGDPIRNVIRRSRRQSFVPAVLRNTEVPTKVLVETANLTNSTDQQRIADPKWRQWFAEAFVNALRRHFNS